MRGMRGSVGSCNDLCEMVIHFSHTRTHKLTIVKHPPPSLNLKPYKGSLRPQGYSRTISERRVSHNN